MLDNRCGNAVKERLFHVHLGTLLSMPMSPRAQGYAFALAAPVCWSFGGVVMRTVDAGPWDIVFWRAIGHLAVFPLVLAVLFKTPILRRMVDAGTVGLASGLLIAGIFVFHVIAMTSTTVANALLLQSTAPVLTALIAWLVLREKVPFANWIAIAIAFAGLAIVIGGKFDGGDIFGKAMAVAVALCGATNATLIGHFRKLDLLPATLVGAAFAAAIGIAFGDVFAVGALDIVALVGLGLLQITIGLTLFYKALETLSPVEVSLIALLEPVLGPLWTFFAVGEEPATSTLVGGGVLISALAFNTLASASAKARR